MTSKELKFATNYNSKYAVDDIKKAYKTCSTKKYVSWLDIKKECDSLNGCGLKVCGWNSSHYTAGFTYVDKQGKKHLLYYTYMNKYDIIL